MTSPAPLVVRPLREQVYDHLRLMMDRGELRPGGFLDLDALAGSLGVSRTPLREALLRLEADGFVAILPRRGIEVKALTLGEIKQLYEIVGALESAALLAVAPRIGKDDLKRLRLLNREMAAAVEAGDFDGYYARNLAFHDVYLGKSDNARLRGQVDVCKRRLYDWPRREGFVPEWERNSTCEHAAFVRRLERGDARGAADHLRDVHWSFAVQERFVRRYYFAQGAEAGAGAEMRADGAKGARVEKRADGAKGARAAREAVRGARRGRAEARP